MKSFLMVKRLRYLLSLSVNATFSYIAPIISDLLISPRECNDVNKAVTYV